MNRFWNYVEERLTPKSQYWLTRFVFLRIMGLVYTVAFLVLVNQVVPLVGSQGLLPADIYMDAVGTRFETKFDAFTAMPTIFWYHISDKFLISLAWTGAALSFLVFIGFGNSILMAVIWFLYMSFTHIGQIFYGYGWEIQLHETGFLAIFLCPLLDPRPFPKSPPPLPIILLMRWLSFRIMFGAGLIKIRGDECWRNLTCLYYHYETQPIPNPLTPYFHHMPKLFHKLGVVFNHFAELVAPFLVFGPRILRHFGGTVMVMFQVILIFSGNLSFLNWLTIAPFIGCFDDTLLKKIMPAWIVSRAKQADDASVFSRTHFIFALILMCVVGYLSAGPVKNMTGTRQIMNTSFDKLHIVNSYGAFGTVGKQRNEIILEGTLDGHNWLPYEFKAKPGDLYRKSPVLSPFHYRVDWQIWFAAMQTPQQNSWLVHLIWKLLHNDPGAISLISGNPFPQTPPRYIRARLFKYEYTSAGDTTGAIWKRELLQQWMPPLSKQNPSLKQFVKARKWYEFEE